MVDLDKMLFKRNELEAIRAGHVKLAFRRWRRPTVKEQCTLMTEVGRLSIDRVSEVDPKKISDEDARKGGREDRASLIKELGQVAGGSVYRIECHSVGEAPRISLRETSSMEEEDFTNIEVKLKRVDAYSRIGPWTTTVLQAIEAHPTLPAIEIAKKTGFEKEWLKTNIRTLKNLGLTISHQPGYELSARGTVVLSRLNEAEQTECSEPRDSAVDFNLKSSARGR